MEIIFLTSVVVTLFVVFGIATYREFSIMSRDGYTPTKERGPRAGLVNFVGRLFDEESIPKKEKKVLYQAMFRTIADMESDGVYFDDDVKKLIIEKREELHCEYSGLPSPKAYEK
jgi:hypothetical protein